MANFSFTRIADTSGGMFSSLRPPAINDAGTLVFRAEFDQDSSEEQGIFTGSGTGTTKITDTLGSFAGFGIPSINSEGTVVFSAVLDEGEDGIFTSNGSTTTTIADTSGLFDLFGFAPAINDMGMVAFNALTDAGEEGIFTSDGSTTTTIADSNGSFQLFSSPTINNEGTVAYRAFLNEVGGIYKGDGTTTTTIADGSGLFSDFFTVPGINDSGDVVFSARRGDEDGIFISDGTEIATIADTAGDFSFFADGTYINNAGQVAFTADLDDAGVALGIYTAPDNAVIAAGDQLLGSTVRGISVLSTGGLNNNGQIAFLANFEDGSTAVFRADPVATPVPEASSSIGLLAIAALATINYFWRNWKQSSKISEDSIN